MVSSDKKYLESLIEPIGVFLQIALRLELHPNKGTIRSWNQGVDFLGFVFRPYAITLRTKTKRRMLAKVSQQNLSSYRGVCAHANTYRLGQVVQLVAWERELRNSSK